MKKCHTCNHEGDVRHGGWISPNGLYCYNCMDMRGVEVKA